jgi:hypothetical protein
MTIYGEYKAPVSKVVEMIRAELARYRGRSWLVARIALACTSVMLLAEVFRIPGAVLGVSFPILISRESPGAARKSAFQIAMACSIATLVVRRLRAGVVHADVAVELGHLRSLRSFSRGSLQSGEKATHPLWIRPSQQHERQVKPAQEAALWQSTSKLKSAKVQFAFSLQRV